VSNRPLLGLHVLCAHPGLYGRSSPTSVLEGVDHRDVHHQCLHA
jgi:hypothetical protein